MLDKKSVSQYAHWEGWNKYEDSCLTTGPDCKLSLININTKHNQVYTWISMVMDIIFLSFTWYSFKCFYWNHDLKKIDNIVEKYGKTLIKNIWN